MASYSNCRNLSSFWVVTNTVLVLLSYFVSPSNASLVIGRPFNSMFYFGNGDPATTDGLLMLDFFATGFGISFPSKNIKKDRTFDFDVSTAMNPYFFWRNGIPFQANNRSLDANFDSYNKLIHSKCSTYNECKKKLSNTVFVLDQIGHEDYKYVFLQAKSVTSVQHYVPQVVHIIKNNTKKLIQSGATNIVVTGSLPMGCLPGFLTIFKKNDVTKYDPHNCLRGMNSFSELHNNHLRLALRQLRKDHPDVNIVYVDVYKAFISLLRHHTILGFNKKTLLKSCCGSGSSYNFDYTKMSVKQALPICTNPSRYLFWDGFHLTQEAMKLLVQVIMNGRGYVFPLAKHSRW